MTKDESVRVFLASLDSRQLTLIDDVNYGHKFLGQRRSEMMRRTFNSHTNFVHTEQQPRHDEQHWPRQKLQLFHHRKREGHEPHCQCTECMTSVILGDEFGYCGRVKRS